jgi:DNA-binding CsgD family transcriptional regulator
MVDASAAPPRVDGQVMRTLLQALERCGHEPLRFVDGGAEALRGLANPRATVAWDELIEALERVADDAGRGEVARVAASFVALHPAPRRLHGFLLPPRLFFQALSSALARTACCQVRARDGANGRLELEVSLNDGCRPSQVFFEACGHALGALPRLLDFPRTRVQVVGVSPNGGHYRVTPGSARGLSLKVNEPHLSTISGLLFDASHGAARPAARAQVPTVALLAERFELTRAEARVARRLAMGRSLKHIAKELEISSETARTHAKRAMQKTQTHRQAELVSVVLGLER